MVRADIPRIESNKDVAVWLGELEGRLLLPPLTPFLVQTTKPAVPFTASRQPTDPTGRTHRGMNEPLLCTHTPSQTHFDWRPIRRKTASDRRAGEWAESIGRRRKVTFTGRDCLTKS